MGTAKKAGFAATAALLAATHLPPAKAQSYVHFSYFRGPSIWTLPLGYGRPSLLFPWYSPVHAFGGVYPGFAPFQYTMPPAPLLFQPQTAPLQRSPEPSPTRPRYREHRGSIPPLYDSTKPSLDARVEELTKTVDELKKTIAALPKAEAAKPAEAPEAAPKPEAAPLSITRHMVSYDEKICREQYDNEGTALLNYLFTFAKFFDPNTNLRAYDVRNNTVIGIRDLNNKGALAGSINLLPYPASMPARDFVNRLVTDLAATPALQPALRDRVFAAVKSIMIDFAPYSCGSVPLRATAGPARRTTAEPRYTIVEPKLTVAPKP